MIEHEVTLTTSVLLTKMELLKETLILLLVLAMLTATHGGGKGGTKHVHFKIHVPELIKHHHHTKTVYIHVGGHGGGHGHGHGHGHHGHGHVHIHHHGHGHGHHHSHGHDDHHGHGHGHHHDHGHHHGHGGHHTHEFHYTDLHHGHGGHHHSHKVHENHHNHGKMWDGQEGHDEPRHMQIESFGTVHPDQKQQDGHIHGDNTKEMHKSVHMLEGGHYAHHEGEGQGGGLDSGKKAIHWNYKGHGHNVDSGGKLGASHGEVLSGSLVGRGHMKHSTDHVLSLGNGGVNGDVHNHISSGHHKGGSEIDNNHFEYAQGQDPCADYEEFLDGDHSELNAGHHHILSEYCKGNVRGGHTQVDHGFGQTLSENYEGGLVGDHNHIDHELGHVFNGGYGAELEDGHGDGKVLRGDYEKSMAGGQNHIDSANGHVLIGDYGGKTVNVNHGDAHVSNENYGGNLGGGANNVRHGDAYISTGDFEGGIMDGHDHMGKGYEVYEHVREAQPYRHQNRGLIDNGSTDVLYVQYADLKTATDLGDRNVDLNSSHELDATKHQYLHKDDSVIVRDIWHNSHNSMEKDHTSFEHSFGINHVDQ